MPEKWTKWMRWSGAKCPHCGVHHDLTKFDYLMLPDNQKPVFSCEKIDEKTGQDVGCGNRFQVVAVDQPVLVRLRRTNAAAGEFTHLQTDEERAAFEASDTWKEMQNRKPR